jgi:hypothetical protein
MPGRGCMAVVPMQLQGAMMLAYRSSSPGCQYTCTQAGSEATWVAGVCGGCTCFRHVSRVHLRESTSAVWQLQACGPTKASGGRLVCQPRAVTGSAQQQQRSATTAKAQHVIPGRSGRLGQQLGAVCWWLQQASQLRRTRSVPCMWALDQSHTWLPHWSWSLLFDSLPLCMLRSCCAQEWSQCSCQCHLLAVCGAQRLLAG